MNISLVEVAGANFRTDEKSDELNTKFMGRLGMRKRFLPARLAIARSLAMPTPLELLDETHEPGKVIKGDTLFGTGTTLSAWLALIVERYKQAGLDAKHLDIKQLIVLVSAHWRRGLTSLDQEWERAEEDVIQFVKRLVDVADLPMSGDKTTLMPEFETTPTFSNSQIDVLIGEIGEDINTQEKLVWSLNSQGSSPHSAIMGGVGSGKTRTAVAMLRSIREQASVPLIVFDFKGDLGTDASGGGYHIDTLFEAQVLEPPRDPIPLNVLSLSSTDDIDISQAALRFRESFARLKGSRLGNLQRTSLNEATIRALRKENPCELHHIRDALISVYEERDMKEDGATSTIQEISQFPLFQPTLSPAEFFQQSWLIRLPPNVPEDSRMIVVNLVLDALDQHLNSLLDAENSPDGSRGLRILCMVDEAHRVLGTKLPSLSNLIRMSRSKGGAVMLISQSPDDFSGEDDEFLSEMGLVAAFSTNAPPRHATRILGKGINLSTLQTGQCVVKRRGDQVAKRIKAW